MLAVHPDNAAFISGETLNQRAVTQLGVVRWEGVERVLQEIVTEPGLRTSARLWNLLTLHLWCEHYLASPVGTLAAGHRS